MSDIYINDVRPRTQVIQTAALAAANQYSFGFPILAKTDLKVAINDDVIDPSEYNVVGEGVENGGHISFNTLSPAIGSRITLWRDMPFERTTDFSPGADLRAAVLNDELDRTALLLQQAEALVGDSLHRRPYDVEQELILPTVSERAGKYLSFDGNGVPEAVSTRVLGDIANLALVYQGPLSTAPELRLDGSVLRDGDLYFDTTAGKLRSYSSGTWADTTTIAPSPFIGGLLDDPNAAAARSTLGIGTAAALDAGTGGDNALQLDSLGRLPAIDGSALTNLAAADEMARDLAVEALWQNAISHGTSNQALVNTYLDVFTDETGVDGPVYGPGASFFDGGTASSITFPSGLTATANPFSMVATVRLDSYEGGQRAAIIHMGQFLWEMYFYSPSQSFNLNGHQPGVGALFPNQKAITLGTKYHVAICHAGGRIDNGVNTKWYINGVENLGRDGSLSDTISLSGTAYIGLSTAAANYDFDGAIAEVGIWSSQLGEAEVSALYNSGGVPVDPQANDGNYVSATNLVHYFPLDEGSGAAPVDRVTSAAAVFSNPGWEADFMMTVAGQSSNQVYLPAGDYYHNPPSVGTTDLVPAMTSNTAPSGTVSGTISGSGTTASNLYWIFDDSTTTAEAQNLEVTYDFGSARSVGGYSVWVFGEGQSRYATAWTVHGSNNGTDWTVLDTQSGQTWSDNETRSFEMATKGSFQYLRYTLNGYSGTFAQIRGIEYFELLPRSNMTVESTSVTCDSPPMELRALVDIQPLEQVSVNTDVTVEVSRDGGTTYTAGILQKVSTDVTEVDGRGVWSATIDVSGQPSGTNARLRLNTLNSKGVALHRWALQADTPLSL